MRLQIIACNTTSNANIEVHQCSVDWAVTQLRGRCVNQKRKSAQNVPLRP